MRDQVTPAGMAVSAMGAERHGTHDLPHREEAEPAAADTPPAAAAHAATPVPELPLDAPAATIPGTLFAASLLSQRMKSFDSAVHALHEVRREKWTPPDSALQLKDRAV